MNCVRCGEEILPLAPNVEQHSGVCCECFSILLSGEHRQPWTQWESFLFGFERGMAAMKKLKENR